MRLDYRLLLALVILAVWVESPAAMAQSDLSDRVDRLERDLNALQTQVYRSQGGSSVITSPAARGASASAPSSNGYGGGSVGGDAYSSLDQRISSLEQQIRDLTGQLEKNGYSVNQLSSKVDRMQADNDLRLKELEQKAGISGGASSGDTAPPPPPSSGNSGGANANGTLGSPPGNLTHPGTKAAPQGASNAPALAGKTPQEQYDYAFGLLRNNDYGGAARAFDAFVSQHPQDPLAGNAMYWRGQIPYAQGQWEQAAPLFLETYSKYPKSAKAGESLLKLGLSMANMNKKKEACAALKRFTAEYPEAADSLKRTAASEKSKLGC